MSRERTCSVCGTPGLTGECPICAEAWEHRAAAEGMTREERARALREIPEILEIDFAKVHQRIEELVGRPVFTHELGTGGMAYLEHEILTGVAPSLDGVLSKFPADKPVARSAIVVDSAEIDQADEIPEGVDG